MFLKAPFKQAKTIAERTAFIRPFLDIGGFCLNVHSFFAKYELKSEMNFKNILLFENICKLKRNFLGIFVSHFSSFVFKFEKGGCLSGFLVFKALSTTDVKNISILL